MKTCLNCHNWSRQGCLIGRREFSHVCIKCNGEMIPSKAIQQTYTAGAPDFPGDSDGDIITVSPGGPGKLVDCMKCKRCGWSAECLVPCEEWCREPGSDDDIGET